MTDLATMSPSEIDTQLADLYRAAEQAGQAIRVAYEHLHQTLGERKARTYGRTPSWPTTNTEALALAKAKAAAGEPPAIRWAGGHGYPEAIEKVTQAEAKLAQIRAAAEPLNDEFIRRDGWSRFFTVPAGHIHSSMNCSTCNKGRYATRFGWNPELSGLTEAEAVAAKGPLLCSVCFPSAPVEWTVGRQETAEEAAADGRCLNRAASNVRRHGRFTIGDCEPCGAKGIDVTMTGLRRHAHYNQLVAAERKARLEDPKLIGTPAGDELKVDGDVYRTVRSAEIAYVDALTWTSDQQRAKAAVLIEALAAKRGVTVEEATAQLAKRVEKKRREYGY